MNSNLKPLLEPINTNQFQAHLFNNQYRQPQPATSTDSSTAYPKSSSYPFNSSPYPFTQISPYPYSPYGSIQQMGNFALSPITSPSLSIQQMGNFSLSPTISSSLPSDIEKQQQQHQNYQMSILSKNFPCQLCDKSYVRSHDLKRHQRAHHFGGQRFPCDLCTALFSRSDALKRHKKDRKCVLKKERKELKALAKKSGKLGLQSDSNLTPPPTLPNYFHHEQVEVNNSNLFRDDHFYGKMDHTLGERRDAPLSGNLYNDVYAADESSQESIISTTLPPYYLCLDESFEGIDFEDSFFN